MGCIGRGCLAIVLLLLFFAAAFLIGGYFGVRYVITSPDPRPIPAVTPPPLPSPGSTAPTESAAEVQQRTDAFDAARERGEAASITYTAADINQLIAANRNSRGKAFVTIENNVARVQMSIPLEKFGFRGRYLNGDFSVAASPDGDPRKLRVTESSLGGIDVPERILNYLIGSKSLHGYIEQYAGEYNVSSCKIIDNKVVLETRGGR